VSFFYCESQNVCLEALLSGDEDKQSGEKSIPACTRQASTTNTTWWICSKSTLLLGSSVTGTGADKSEPPPLSNRWGRILRRGSMIFDLICASIMAMTVPCSSMEWESNLGRVAVSWASDAVSHL